MEENVLDKFGGTMKLFQKTPIENTTEEFLRAFNDAFKTLVDKRQEKLLEEDLEYGRGGKYFQYWDTDSVDVGVGSVVVRKEAIQDEEMAWNDAKDEIIEEFVSGDFETIEEIFYNENFSHALGNYLKGKYNG